MISGGNIMRRHVGVIYHIELFTKVTGPNKSPG